jgi:hypothetical protein
MKIINIIHKILIFIFSLILLFHLSIITGLIDYSIVWGGRLKSKSEMYSFELTSILLNLFFLMIVLVDSKAIKLKTNSKYIRISYWLMFILFFFNTLGNLFTKSSLETKIFTPVTIVLTILCLALIILKRKEKNEIPKKFY